MDTLDTMGIRATASLSPAPTLRGAADSRVKPDNKVKLYGRRA